MGAHFHIELTLKQRIGSPSTTPVHGADVASISSRVLNES
jgi:hypothetical protein